MSKPNRRQRRAAELHASEFGSTASSAVEKLCKKTLDAIRAGDNSRGGLGLKHLSFVLDHWHLFGLELDQAMETGKQNGFDGKRRVHNTNKEKELTLQGARGAIRGLIAGARYNIESAVNLAVTTGDIAALSSDEREDFNECGEDALSRLACISDIAEGIGSFLQWLDTSDEGNRWRELMKTIEANTTDTTA